MKLTNTRCAFLFSAVVGLLLCVFSRTLTGHREPWDGNIYTYVAILALTGFFFSFYFKAHPKCGYWGMYVGQCLLAVVPLVTCALGYWCEKVSNLFPVGMVFLLFASLPAYLGGWIALKIRRI